MPHIVKVEVARDIKPEPLRKSAKRFSAFIVRDPPLTAISQLSASQDGETAPHSRETNSVKLRPQPDKTAEPLHPTNMRQYTTDSTLESGQDQALGDPGSDSVRMRVQNSATVAFPGAIECLEGLLEEALETTHDSAQMQEDQNKKALAECDLVDSPDLEREPRLTPTGVKAISDRAVEPPSQIAFLETARAQSRPTIPERLHRLDSLPKSDIYTLNPSSAASSCTEIHTACQNRAQPYLRKKSQRLVWPNNKQTCTTVPSPEAKGNRNPSGQSVRGRSCEEHQSKLRKKHRGERRRIPLNIMPRTTSKCAVRAKLSRGNSSQVSEPHAISILNVGALKPYQDSNQGRKASMADHFGEMFHLESNGESSQNFAEKSSRHVDLSGRRHVDIKDPHSFNVHESGKRQPSARNWTVSRKRFAATMACINTALIGIIVGIYAGEVPAIQYMVADLGHLTILGNALLYLGLSVPTLCLWPLPLMHGRKPYTTMALTVAMCLQIPQGIAVSQYRTVKSTYRTVLLLSRAMSGLSLGFVNINTQATLLDVFGASLQSSNPNDEIIDPFDVRRHGGGMGIWLGLWSWCFIGSISLGFFIGTLFVQDEDISWGFWVCIILMMVALLLNVISPEVRRSAYRRTVAEVTGDEGNVSRVCRGEVKMHLKLDGPYWWGEEVKAGLMLVWKMLRQPGFTLMAVYAGWVYAQFTLIMMLLGALTSRYYGFKSVHVGLCVLGLGLGALIATPFEKASIFSRARRHRQRTDSMTLQGSFVWSSHLLRRALFTLLLPFASIAYVLASRGSTIHVAVPTFFAASVGFLSNLALAECQGILMETFDTSDLQPGMTGRPNRRRATMEREQRTDFTCYPRISAGIAVTQSLSFFFAAIATAVGGRIERRLGARQAAGVFAGVLMSLTLLLTLVLFRFRVVRMIPDALPTIEYIARSNTTWEPVVIGQPSGMTRKISILESGSLTRWSEIRLRNRLTNR